jgi:hypothetical protein
MIQLTSEQRSAIENGLAIKLRDPDIAGDIVILSAEAFAALEMRRDQEDQDAIVAAAMRTTAQRLIEDEEPN